MGKGCSTVDLESVLFSLVFYKPGESDTCFHLVVFFLSSGVAGWGVQLTIVFGTERNTSTVGYIAESDGGWRVIDGICYSAGVG